MEAVAASFKVKLLFGHLFGETWENYKSQSASLTLN
jgi:hypothetical protein